ncbi:unnamed protein product [Larinioides sclopetarius]|uniref:GATA zinc finger domain-containing protein 14-like n=1 Tax=Larinioides sclopetarius TaxID=280406 RepID=A0AAV1YVT1_9ARAC
MKHPVILGFLWSFLIQSLSGQPQISSQETNKVYAYSYHFLHNGTTNSKDILRTVLGADPDFENDPPAGQSIVKTFSSPSIRGFFSKGVLPAGPISQSYNSGFGSHRNANSAIENIRKVVEANLQPPANIATGLLPPISPDISSGFPGDFNNVNDIGLNFQKQDDFPKIPPPPPPLPPFQNQDNFPRIPQPPQIQPVIQNDFPKIPDPVINNNGVSNVETFSRNTPDGGKIEGKVETFSYNPPPVVNSNSNHQQNAQGFRRQENFVNNNNQVTGHRTQSYFRQSYRTVTPNLDSNIAPQNNRIDNNIGNGNTNNQWWNALNVLGGNNNNNNLNKPNTRNLGQDIANNINQIKQNLNNEMNRQFGSRLSNFNNNRQINTRQNVNNGYNNQNNNINTRNRHQNNIAFNQRVDSFRNPLNTNNIYPNNNANNQQNNLNNQYNNNQVPNIPFNNQRRNNVVSNSQVGNARLGTPNNLNNKFHNDDTTKRVLNIINDVNSQLNNMNNPGVHNNNFRLTWDDDVTPNFNSDWSRRQSVGNGRPFSNAHSGPLSNQAGPKPNEILKSTVDAIIGNRDFPVPPIPDIGNQGGNYRNSGGGGAEKFFGFDRTVEGPNSFSRNQQRGFERNFHVNSNSGYQHNNQWSTNTVRRLDAQSSKADFSKDFIDVFRDDF